MLISLLKFEVSYQLRQRSFVLFSLLFLSFGYMIGAQGFAREGILLNSPFQVAYNAGLFTLGCVFVIMFFTVSGVLRDSQYRSEALIYSTAISKSQFFISRFLGVFLFSLLAFSPVVLGIALAHTLAPLDPERLAPFSLAPYFNAWTLLVLPNVFICTCVIFAVSMLSKNQTLTYLGAVLIYVLYWVCAIFLNSPLLANAVPVSPENLVYAALADPFGLSAFFEKTQYWTPFQKNSDSLTLSGYFLWNRVVWIGLGFGLLAITYGLFSFRKLNEKIKSPSKSPFFFWRRKRFNDGHENDQDTISLRAYRPVPVQSGAITQWQSFFSLLKIELNSVFKGLPFIGIMLFWLIITISEIYSKIYEGGDYHDSLYPANFILIREFTSSLWPFTLMLIIFYSGEIVFRERTIRFNGIGDATPASNLVLFSSKFIALTLLPFFLILSGLVCVLGFQLAGGYFRFEPGLYLSVFYYHGISILFYILLAMFVQTLAANKYLGMGVTLLLILLFGSFLTPRLGIEHPMLRLGRLPEVSYSDMAGYSGETRAFHHYAAYWMSLGFLFMLLSFRLWERGTVHSFIFRLKRAFTRLPQWQMAAMVLLTLGFISSAALIYYQTNIEGTYMTTAQQLDQLEQYERQYKKYDSLERLYPLQMKTKVDLFPEKNAFDIRADLVLINNSTLPVAEMLITERETLDRLELGNSELIRHDPELGVYLFRFRQAVQPGQQVKFSYTLHKTMKGFETSESVVGNGSYLSQRAFEPVLGYRSGLEISDRFEREKRKLPVRPEEITTDEHLADETATGGTIDFETVVSTTAGQTAIAPGDLIKTWTKGGRAYFSYRSSQKILPVIAYFSGKYAVKKEMYKGTSIEQYYHPGHDFNVENIAANTRQTLDYCMAQFGAYPFRHLRIVEVPAHWNFGGFAHAGTIAMVENRLYLTDQRNPEAFDLVAKRTIHEVAHQWWGHTLQPRNIAGASLMIEGFAKYTEAVVMEKHHGPASLWQLANTANRTYFSGRSESAGQEPPVYLVDGQGYIDYGKGYMSLMALRDLMGEEKLNAIIKTVTDRHRGQYRQSLTSLEFLNEVYKVTPPAQHALIDDWFKRVITYDLSVKDPKVTPLKDGRYEVSFTLKAQRLETQKDGSTKPIAINEPLMMGVFSKHPSDLRKGDKAFYLQTYHITQKETFIKFVLQERPGFVGVDPFGVQVDRDLGDNGAALK